MSQLLESSIRGRISFAFASSWFSCAQTLCRPNPGRWEPWLWFLHWRVRTIDKACKRINVIIQLCSEAFNYQYLCFNLLQEYLGEDFILDFYYWKNPHYKCCQRTGYQKRHGCALAVVAIESHGYWHCRDVMRILFSELWAHPKNILPTSSRIKILPPPPFWKWKHSVARNTVKMVGQCLLWQCWWVSLQRLLPNGFAKAGCYETKGMSRSPSGKAGGQLLEVKVPLVTDIKKMEASIKHPQRADLHY